MASFDLKTLTGEIITVDDAVLKALPFISSIIGFVPGAQTIAPLLPLVAEILGAVDNAAKEIQAGNSGAALDDILKEIRNHLTPGLPNSAVLSGPAIPQIMPKADTA